MDKRNFLLIWTSKSCWEAGSQKGYKGGPSEILWRQAQCQPPVMRQSLCCNDLCRPDWSAQMSFERHMRHIPLVSFFLLEIVIHSSQTPWFWDKTGRVVEGSFVSSWDFHFMQALTYDLEYHRLAGHLLMGAHSIKAWACPLENLNLKSNR